MKNRLIIARKYAKAFLNLFIDEISLDDFQSIKNLERFFQDHKTSLYFLSIPNIKTEKKISLLMELLEKFKLLELLEPLIMLLAEQKRLFLINETLHQIRMLYKERKNIMMFNITSSHDVDASDLDIIEKFLAFKTGKAIMSNYKTDKCLIAGIRMQSNTLLWEYSIHKQCETLRKQFNI